MHAQTRARHCISHMHIHTLLCIHKCAYLCVYILRHVFLSKRGHFFWALYNQLLLLRLKQIFQALLGLFLSPEFARAISFVGKIISLYHRPPLKKISFVWLCHLIMWNNIEGELPKKTHLCDRNKLIRSLREGLGPDHCWITLGASNGVMQNANSWQAMFL